MPTRRSMMAVVLLVVLVVVATAVEASSRGSSSPVGESPSLVSTRAHQLLLALDTNGDHRVSHEEAASMEGKAVLEAFFPETDGHAEFASFIEAADTSGDGALDQDELDFALHSGLRQSPEFLELDATRGRVGFFKAIGNVAKKLWNGAKKAVTGFFGIDTKKLSGDKQKGQEGQQADPNEACVMCQYIVERMETNVKNSGILPRPGGDYDRTYAAATSFLETGAETATPGQTNARRAATHNLRLAERAKYNQIYRAADITLDDVCEQAMPDQYYAHCKSIYAIQADLVDGLRYQYRPADICYKVGMCAKGSYITTGIHNQRRFAAIEQAKKQADLYETCNDPMTC